MNIQGAIITIDAMGTQKAIAEQIVDRGADFVLALKGNQETLHQAVIDYIDKQMENDFADVLARRLLTTDKAHGRQETVQLHPHAGAAGSGGLGVVERPADDWRGNVGVRARWQRNDRDALLHQQPGAGREARRRCGAQSLGHRK